MFGVGNGGAGAVRGVCSRLEVIFIYMCLCMCMYLYMYICVSVYVHIYVCVCMCMCMCVYVYIYICIDTSYLSLLSGLGVVGTLLWCYCC